MVFNFFFFFSFSNTFSNPILKCRHKSKVICKLILPKSMNTMCKQNIDLLVWASRTTSINTKLPLINSKLVVKFRYWVELWMPEEHIIQTYSMPDHFIFNLLQEIKDDLKPSTRSHATQRLSKLIATLHFLAYRVLFMCCGYFINLFI